MMKRFITIILCTIIAFTPLLSCNLSFAETSDGGVSSGGAWDPVDMSDHKTVVAAFKAYTSSRNFDISHVPNSVQNIVQFDYIMIKNAADKLNIDLTTLNAYIWYTNQKIQGYDNNYIKFFFKPTALTQLSQIYGQIIEDNQITPNSTKTIYSGKLFRDQNGNTCYCFVVNTKTGNGNIWTQNEFLNRVTGRGSYYITTGNKLFADLGDLESYTLSITGYNTNLLFKKFYNFNSNKDIINAIVAYTSNYIPSSPPGSPVSSIYYKDDYYTTTDGFPTIIYYPNSGQGEFWLGIYNTGIRSNNNYFYTIRSYSQIENAISDNATVDANQGEENNDPENKSLVSITNNINIDEYIENQDNDTTNNYDDDDEPPVPPQFIFPIGIINNSPVTIELPDLNDLLPDSNMSLPNGFKIPALKNKFPFCIPFDLIAVYEFLDTEPIAPKIDQDIQFSTFTWSIDIDLADYDEYMIIIRKFILLSYIFGLLFVTPQLLK